MTSSAVAFGTTVTVDRAAEDPELDRLLGLARRHLGADVAWLTTAHGDQHVVVAISGPAQDVPRATRALAGRLPGVGRELGLGSCAGVAWHDASGRVAGLLGGLSRDGGGLDESAPRHLALVADLIAEHLRSPAAHALEVSRQNETAVRHILAAGALNTVVQPVVRLTDGVTVAVEALSRFDPGFFATPDRAFAAADTCGLGLELELLALHRALEEGRAIPAGTWLGINLSAATVSSPAAQEMLLRNATRGLGVEITEHTPIADYQQLNAALEPLRSAGIGIVVDDAGAGFASLSHILQLRPDTIKLDISLVRTVHQDPVRRALARSLVGFAAEIGAYLIAEGVETEAERNALNDLGVVYGQGYLWGRPEPINPRVAR